jgi:hypothetical protein
MPGRLLRAIVVSGVAAIIAAASLVASPVAHAAPGDDPNLIYDCTNIVFGFCGPRVTDVLSPNSQVELNSLLQNVPGYQRQLFVDGLNSLGPYGAEYQLQIYSLMPQETVDSEISRLSTLIQNFSPDYQRALLIDYFQHQ